MLGMRNLRHKSLRAVVVMLALATFSGGMLVLSQGGWPPRSVSFSQSTTDLEAYDFVEITANVSLPHAMNPFVGVVIRGTFEPRGGEKKWDVEGFADSEDGSVYRVRFMPAAAGEYTYSVHYRQGGSTTSSTGEFRVRDGGRRGPIRVDPLNRWHFIWEGTGEHYF